MCSQSQVLGWRQGFNGERMGVDSQGGSHWALASQMLLPESQPRPQNSWTLSSSPGEAARSMPSVGTRSYVGSRILPALHMPLSHFLRQSFRKWSPLLSNESISRIVFPYWQPIFRCDCDRTPSHHGPTNLLLSRGSTSPQVPLSRTWRWGPLGCPRRAPSGGQAWCGQF